MRVTVPVEDDLAFSGLNRVPGEMPLEQAAGLEVAESHSIHGIHVRSCEPPLVEMRDAEGDPVCGGHVPQDLRELGPQGRDAVKALRLLVDLAVEPQVGETLDQWRQAGVCGVDRDRREMRAARGSRPWIAVFVYEDEVASRRGRQGSALGVAAACSTRRLPSVAPASAGRKVGNCGGSERALSIDIRVRRVLSHVRRTVRLKCA